MNISQPKLRSEKFDDDDDNDDDDDDDDNNNNNNQCVCLSKRPACSLSRSLTDGCTRPSLAADNYTVLCLLQGSFRLKYNKRQLKEIKMTSFPDALSVI